MGVGRQRILDYLQTDPDVDGAKVGVTGHSRGASCAGGDGGRRAICDWVHFVVGRSGADLYRRNYGETMGNICGVEEFHWFAGSFMRYGAVGHSANEMPVDSHEFIALLAPRPVFIGGGALLTDPQYAPGDAWQDAEGMFKAAVAASPHGNCWDKRGWGRRRFADGDADDSGRIAFRQHQYGHTQAPNWPAFMEFAEKQLGK